MPPEVRWRTIDEYPIAGKRLGRHKHHDDASRGYEADQATVVMSVDHSRAEYARGSVGTNSIENFWTLLKRGLLGTYVAVEPEHLFRYVDERAFAFNLRHLTDLDRFQTVLRRVAGLRLTYAELIGA